jgi:DNA-directed RNA polymerase specialized sigma24 family protein
MSLTHSPDAIEADRAELDEVTLRRAQGGDREAFRVLVDTYKRRVFALLSRMLFPQRRQALVEDLAQETFLRAFRSLASFGREGQLRLSAWLLTIAARLALTETKRRPLGTEPLEAIAQTAASTARADESVERARWRLALGIAVGDLAPDIGRRSCYARFTVSATKTLPRRWGLNLGP